MMDTTLWLINLNETWWRVKFHLHSSSSIKISIDSIKKCPNRNFDFKSIALRLKFSIETWIEIDEISKTYKFTKFFKIL